MNFRLKVVLGRVHFETALLPEYEEDGADKAKPCPQMIPLTDLSLLTKSSPFSPYAKAETLT